MSSTRSKDRALIATTSSLVEFLRDVALAKQRRIVDVNEYETVLWLNDLPSAITVDVNARPGETLLTIPRLRGEAPPEPPAALTNWIDRDSLTDSTARSPVLKEKGPAWVVVEQPDGNKVMAAKILRREEAPDVGRAFENYLPAWHAWAARDKRHEPYRRWYNQLASAAHLATQQEDQYEVVLGTGLLSWRSPAGTRIRNHILTTRLIAIVDADRDEVRIVVDDESATRPQDRELLDQEEGFDATRVEGMHDLIREGAVNAPLVDCEPLAKVWAERALDVETPFIVDWAPTVAVEANAEVRLAPALVLRKRERASLIGYYDAMLHALRGPKAQAPLGLAQLVTSMEADERLAWLDEAGAASGEVLGADPLFPLPANPEQMRIMERLRSNNGVVVQGPPGTGKTHTIANLVSALLAQGQRVLVTSQKAQALRVLRDKLPAEVAKLCVSITDLGRGGSSELEGSVKAMSNRYAGYDPTAHTDEVARSAQKRAELLARVELLTDEVRRLRETETVSHPEVAPGYSGTLAEIARRLQSARARCGWMPVPMPEGIDQPPLGAYEFGELVRLRAAQTPQRKARLTQRPLDVESYPSTDEVRTLIAAEYSARNAAEQGSTEVSRMLDSCDEAVIASLRASAEQGSLVASLLGLGSDARRWDAGDFAVRGITDGLNGHNRMLWDQLEAGRAQFEAAQRSVQSLGFRQVLIGAGAPGTATARLELVRPFRESLARGGKFRGGLLRSGEQRDAEKVLIHATVDGMPVTTAEHVNLVFAVLEAQACVETLGRGWAMVGADVVGPVDEPVHQSLGRVMDAYARLGHVRRFLEVVLGVRKTLSTTQAWLPLTDRPSWQAFVDGLEAVKLRFGAENASEILAKLAERFAIDSRAADAPPELSAAAAALTARDVPAYADALAGLGAVERQQTEQKACDALLERLRATHPVLAALVEKTAADAVWPARVAEWEAAWAWGRANTFFLAQRQAGREQQLETELADTIARVRLETAVLAAAQAWGHCMSRMTAHQAQALQAYEQHMRSLGKGTGRYADKYRSLAREAMRQARNAVPAWIMPLDMVLETLAPVRDSFDVVIVDEASQASLEDLFLLWLAPRVIVVGDDKQCAPSQVRLGELEPIFDKLNSYLPELPGYLRDAYTPRSSLFDLLRTRFGAVIPLREHFRCMPEIIEYSSRQFYSDEPLVPLRQFGADRLQPLRAVRVKGAVTKGTATRLRNDVEAEAIVSQIEVCLADPTYAGRTFGVVVLQGTGQVQLLHQKLLQRVEPKQWERRRLRVGTPPDFQGDERDVIFISMVVAEKRTAVTGMEWQRRFNVAASRARDQLWLFHSVTPDLLSLVDLRSSLLSYVLNPPPALPTKVYSGISEDDPHPAFKSLFDQRVFRRIQAKGYHVTPGVEVNGRKIDMVVTGASGRLAVECDGTDWTGTQEQREADLDRERELKRAGWRFWRVRESEFQYDPDAALKTLWTTLRKLEIGGYDPDEAAAAASAATEWQPTVLSNVEGLDGLDNASPDEIDDVHLTPVE
jgi:very-short-patch-repair endonuclease